MATIATTVVREIASTSPEAAPSAVCVYCGASPGTKPTFQKAAVSVGQALARAKRQLIFGGSPKGLMGIVSSSCLKAGGEVTGIIPYAMASTGGEGIGEEYEQRGRTRTIIVEDMHSRKMKMASLAEGGFIALPGGYGTLEEIFEVTTWSQLGIHSKPVVLMNVLGYFNPLRQFIDSAVEAGFIQPHYAKLITFVDAPPNVLDGEYNWGKAALDTLEKWDSRQWEGLFRWAKL